MMFAVIGPSRRAGSVYTHIDLARDNCRDGQRVVPLPPEVDAETALWDDDAQKWRVVDPIPTVIEQRRRHRDHRVRRAQAYAERLDTGLVQEVALDVVLALAADPAFRKHLRPSTRDKIDALAVVIAAVKDEHPE